MSGTAAGATRRLQPTLRLVIALNLTFFVIEFIVAEAIGAVSLLADSVDFVEDAALSLLALTALRFSALVRARIGFALAAILLLPAIAFIVTLIRKFTGSAPAAPEAVPFALMGFVALLVNTTCAVLLARVRDAAGSLTRAAFLSARNDTLANIAIMAAAGITALWPSVWPDIVVGLGVAALNAGAAGEIFEAAREEHRDARAD